MDDKFCVMVSVHSIVDFIMGVVEWQADNFIVEYQMSIFRIFFPRDI